MKNVYEKYLDLWLLADEIDHYIDLMYDLQGQLPQVESYRFREKFIDPIEEVCEDMGDIMYEIRQELGLN